MFEGGTELLSMSLLLVFIIHEIIKLAITNTTTYRMCSRMERPKTNFVR